MAETFVPIAVASRKSGIPYRSLRRLIQQGRVPSVRFAGIPRVRLSHVLGVIEERGADLSGLSRPLHSVVGGESETVIRS